MNKDCTVLMLKHLTDNSLQVMAACLLLTLFSIALPAKYKVTESMTWLATMHLPTRLYCDLSCQLLFSWIAQDASMAKSHFI